jgi:hypothetical protein
MSVPMMTAIAQQSKLLQLNATIDAARAAASGAPISQDRGGATLAGTLDHVASALSGSRRDTADTTGPARHRPGPVRGTDELTRIAAELTASVASPAS